MKKISGKFTVKMEPGNVSFDGVDEVIIGRMALAKSYQGLLEATSKGEMITAVTSTQGSAGYVAIEQVVGFLEGKAGSFVLQHSGIMNQGQSQLKLVVVPDSGSGELENLNGTMAIRIEDGQHYYDFEYNY